MAKSAWYWNVMKRMTNATVLPSTATCIARTTWWPLTNLGEDKTGLIHECTETLNGVPRGNEEMYVLTVGDRPIARQISQRRKTDTGVDIRVTTPKHSVRNSWMGVPDTCGKSRMSQFSKRMMSQSNTLCMLVEKWIRHANQYDRVGGWDDD
jgi:hypothetical protein